MSHENENETLVGKAGGGGGGGAFSSSTKPRDFVSPRAEAKIFLADLG